MKNIYVLPTDKPSRLGYLTKKGKEVFNDLRLFEKPMPNILDSENQNIYITSDEKPKAGDYAIATQNGNSEVVQLNQSTCIYYNFKIILTTDQDLINDGVQAINDEFLEWFVKNPGCEDVETYSLGLKNQLTGESGHYKYEIIIPKEEPKYPIGGYAPGYYGCTCVTCKTEFMGDKRAVQCEPCAIKMTKEEPKQETLEEAAERINSTSGIYDDITNELIMMAKWQQEQNKNKFSEENMQEYAEFCIKCYVKGLPCIIAKDWFEQYKNK